MSNYQNFHKPGGLGETLGFLDQNVKKDFDINKRILSFDEYLGLLSKSKSETKQQLRNSSQYLLNMIDYFGPSETDRPTTATDASPPLQQIYPRFKVFDFPVNGNAIKVVGQESVQNHIYRTLRTFHQQKFNNKLLLLHGPNGSAKSTILHALMNGIEKYSHQSEGAVYTFSWVFPLEKYTRSGIGLNSYSTARAPLQSFAKLPDEEITSRIPCEMKDHPFLIIPQELRKVFLEKSLGPSDAAEILEELPQYLAKGDLCHRCKMIFEALLNSHAGDYKKILMHIQVERFYFSRRFKKGLVTIEPQLHVDAQYHQLTYNRSVSAIPTCLQNLNLFSLTGDLIDGNRGMIEFSDLLKRPLDTFKYLLSACESGSVNVGNSIAYVDSLMFGSTNEIQLDAFKEFPDFTSFKARIELIKVPYLLSVGSERQIYENQLQQFSGDKHVAPHVTWIVSLWAVLTRLKKPNSINYPPQISSLVSNLTPLEKSKYYDLGEGPVNLSSEDRKLIRSAYRRVQEEYKNIPYYEGRMGASAREIKSILFDAAHDSDFNCLSPLGILKQLEELVKKVTEFEFLRQDVKDGYHDSLEFINTVRTEYLNFVDWEVRSSMGLYDSNPWEEFIKKYVQHISLLIKREKIKNPITGNLEDPDLTVVDEFEKIMEVSDHANAKDHFRQNIISQIGAWALEHKGQSVKYNQVFPDFWKKLEAHFFESQKPLLLKIREALMVFGSDDDDPTAEGSKLLRITLNNMTSKHGYCDNCARDTIFFLMRQRY